MAKSVFDEIKSNPNYSYGKSIEWYRKQIRGLALKARDPRLLNDRDRIRKSVEPGFLYLFAYDPKHKATLPFYDRFPLSFVFDFAKDGFYGINFHYLPYDMRFALFDRMSITSYENKEKFDDKMKMRLNWNILKNASRFPQVQPAVKHYLMDHVESNFIKLPISDWKTALLLPVEQFVGASTKSVWAQSRKIIRG